MSKNGYRPIKQKTKYVNRYNQTNNIKNNRSNPNNQYNNIEENQDYFSQIYSQERPGRIIHQSTEHSFDDQGNRIVTTKTVRELDSIGNPKKQIIDIKNSYGSKASQVSKQEKIGRIPKYTNAKNEVEKQRALYSSPDFQSGSPYNSPVYVNDMKNYDDFDEVGYQTNYRYESKNVNGRTVGNYTQKETYEYSNKTGNRQIYGNSRDDSPNAEIISPVGYMANYSSGSEFEDNQMKSFDNYQTSGINDNSYNFMRNPKNRNLNYELEDPEGFDYLANNQRNKNKKNNYNQEFKRTQYLNRSEYRTKIIDDSYQSDKRDFQSPDRNHNEDKRFRNVTVGMIDSKGPTNDDRKVTKIMTSKVVNINGNKVYEENVKKTKMYKNKQKPKDKKNLSKIDAAKIIQAWWRRRYAGEEEVYDITVKKAIKLQSFIRGFLVRKKVLRYITLAIYYQSFCDKLQDVLCNHVKRDIFNYLKEKILHIKPNNQNPNIGRRSPKVPIIENINTDTNINKNLPNNKNITTREMIINKTKKTIQRNIPNIPQNRSPNQQIFKTTSSRTTTRNNKHPSNYPSTINNQSSISYPSPSYTNNTQIISRSPDTYERRETDLKIYHISPDYYNQNRNDYYHSHVFNKSINSVKTREITDNRQYYNRVENIDDRERNISPTFGILNKNKTTTSRVLTTNYSSTNINNRKKLSKVNSTQNIVGTTTTTKKTKKIVTTTNKSAKKPVTKTIIKRKKNTKISKIPKQKNEIISGGTLSIVKLPNRRMNYSESEDVYTHIKEKKIEKYERYGTEKKQSKLKQVNTIDNQLSINIVKLADDKQKNEIIREKDKKVREEYVKFIEKPVEVIKEKEKIIVKKEPKPETAEEGNDAQVFDMKVCKRVAMSIEASTETKEIIRDELKEIEIFKKREREKNKQIDKYKKDIQLQKLKNKLDKLKGAIRITDYWRNRNLTRKFKQFKNNCFSVPNVYEVEVGTDLQIMQKPKEKKEFGIQIMADTVDESSQVTIKVEEKKVKNFDVLNISKNRAISFEPKIKKKEIIENKITKSRLNIFSKIPKKDSGQQSEPWETKISNIKNNINIIHKKPETVEESAQYTHVENIIDQPEEIQILRNKPLLIDMEVQHEPKDNEIDEKLVIEIKGTKPEVSESVTQYEKPLSEIIKNAPLSVIGVPRKEIIIKKETADAECNTFNETVEQGVNAVIEEEPKPKNIEVQLRTVKRSLIKMEIPLLKKIWKRKAFRTFRDNCRRPEYHKVIGREILRMALLKWRFIKGYGPDRYGNAYDRDGNLLYKTKAKVADMEVQHEFKVEQEEQSTQYIPIENVITTLRQIEIGAAYKKKIEPEKVEIAVGDNTRLAEVIQRGEVVSYKYKKKEKPENKIAKNQRLEIKKTKKELVEEGTEMPVVQNTITNSEKLNISGAEYKLRNKNNLRKKELLIQMIYRKMMGDKLTLSDSLRQWLKQTLLLLQIEQYDLDKKKRRYASISKAERFALIEEIKRMEMGTQMEKQDNKIETMPNINVIRIKEKKDMEVNVNIPSQFDIESIKPRNENKITYKSNKKPLVLETHKENDMNIYSQDYIFKEEVKKGIHHPMTEEGKRRVSEILIKYFQTRGDPISVLKKYFTIWHRKANYLACLENAKIITQFCRRNLNRNINYRKWKKICEKLIFREKMKIIKLSRVEELKRNKIFDLIRLTRINTVLAKRRYLHYILLCWLAYTRNINRKRKHVKALYENMLNTYMHMADDVFGNNQKENPSVQDALFEAVESDKFHTQNLHDVPVAEKYYEDKKEIKKVTTNITYINNPDKDIEPKEYVTYKAFVSTRPLPTSSSSGNIKEKVIKQKIIKVGAGERLQSRGRGRKFRTNVEKEILNKFYDDKNIYNKIKREEVKEEDNQDNNNNIDGNFRGNKTLTVTVSTNKMSNNMDGSYNYNMGNKGTNNLASSYSYKIETKVVNNKGSSYNYNMDNNNKDIIPYSNQNKNEMSNRKKRALFGVTYKKEDEKENEEEN